ncbi:polysaccharide deacetylase family protein [Pleionea mediterranea]|uniref:Polysaccharide deacetylase n=1 Tax=Pleionea mediterranea TaxID=523701 RepID=A0A316FBZ9_9GAMM|nr:polysaccharide deacetylase family protein [Pleionea mediterranea]PWK44426.1 polysaccharide deacetylase [Pleionea mediterranea]
MHQLSRNLIVAFSTLCAMLCLTYSDNSFANNKANNDNSLVILVYHHIDTKTPAATSTDPDLFQQHLEYLKDNNFSVLPVEQAVKQLMNGQSLPDKAVSITFDDGYESIYTTAFPLLKQYNFPFSVFVSTQPINQQFAAMMNWSQINEMTKSGATILNHTVSHAHLLELNEQQLNKEITHAQDEIKQNVGRAPAVFAYPFGEYSRTIAKQLEQQNYFALAQYSGPASLLSDPQALPRFSMSGNYAKMEQFTLKVNTKPMPIINQNDYEPVFDSPQQTFELSFAKRPAYADQINCFFNGQRLEQLHWDDEQLEIHLPEAPNEGRSRINCTAPAGKGRFYWHSLPIFTTPKNGKWPD